MYDAWLLSTTTFPQETTSPTMTCGELLIAWARPPPNPRVSCLSAPTPIGCVPNRQLVGTRPMPSKDRRSPNAASSTVMPHGCAACHSGHPITSAAPRGQAPRVAFSIQVRIQRHDPRTAEARRPAAKYPRRLTGSRLLQLGCRKYMSYLTRH
ncbi:unnamed protein product [Prorocentrum cordatum]|uniref:Uncharacterized protein n=1 Tax=Prorocentrum cordatum TaxID=2364126 RepID=A0ABN9XBW0_9DINO|nr:unnamed protein product [Polarella glacialis]